MNENSFEESFDNSLSSHRSMYEFYPILMTYSYIFCSLHKDITEKHQEEATRL